MEKRDEIQFVVRKEILIRAFQFQLNKEGLINNKTYLVERRVRLGRLYRSQRNIVVLICGVLYNELYKLDFCKRRY